MKRLKKTNEYYRLHESLKLTYAWLKQNIKQLETCKMNKLNITDFEYELQTTTIFLNGIVKNGNLKDFINKVKENS